MSSRNPVLPPLQAATSNTYALTPHSRRAGETARGDIRATMHKALIEKDSFTDQQAVIHCRSATCRLLPAT